MNLTTKLLDYLGELTEVLDKTSSNFYRKLASRGRELRRQLDMASTPAPLIYARLHTGEIECPHCHTLMVFHRGRKRTAGWDQVSRVLTCGKCSKAWTLAVCLYRHHRTRAIGIPADQLPDAQMRAQIASGYMFPEGLHKRPRQSNIVMLEGCLCTPGEWRSGTNPACPVHPPRA